MAGARQHVDRERPRSRVGLFQRRVLRGPRLARHARVAKPRRGRVGREAAEGRGRCDETAADIVVGAGPHLAGLPERRQTRRRIAGLLEVAG